MTHTATDKRPALVHGITYYQQGKPYTCGCAALRMALSKFMDDVPSEEVLEQQLQTSDKIGTHPRMIHKVAKEVYGLKVRHGEQGTLEFLDELIQDGYVVILAISVDVPHFVLYLGSNSNTSFFHDPYFGKNLTREKKKWISEKQRYPFFRWRVTPKEFLPDHDFSADGLASDRYWMAVKK